MRSPSRARFPSRAGLAVALLLAGTACTGGESAAPSPTATRRIKSSPTPVPAGSVTSPGGGSEGAATEGTARVVDKDKRRTVRGSAPRYVEIERASVRGTLDALTFTAALSGPVPATMPAEDEVLRVSFMVTAPGGRRYQFDAQCVRTGWGAFASGGTPEEYLPEIAIEGRRVGITVDRAYMQGAPRFAWVASVAWTQGENDYAFDSAPAGRLATYP